MTVGNLSAIPEGWRADVDAAVKYIVVQIKNRVFAVREEETTGANGAEIIFTLYEDGPDFAHRLGTYKLGRNRVLYRLDELADGELDTWVRLDGTAF